MLSCSALLYCYCYCYFYFNATLPAKYATHFFQFLCFQLSVSLNQGCRRGGEGKQSAANRNDIYTIYILNLANETQRFWWIDAVSFYLLAWQSLKRSMTTMIFIGFSIRIYRTFINIIRYAFMEHLVRCDLLTLNRNCRIGKKGRDEKLILWLEILQNFRKLSVL